MHFNPFGTLIYKLIQRVGENEVKKKYLLTKEYKSLTLRPWGRRVVMLSNNQTAAEVTLDGKQKDISLLKKSI